MFVKARGVAGDQGPRSVRRSLEGEPRRGEGRRQDLPATGTRSRSSRYRYTVKIFPLQVHGQDLPATGPQSFECCGDNIWEERTDNKTSSSRNALTKE